ncbi:MAG: hypothetical protein AAGA05_14360, partial [Pseudomonadota bacterium]
ETVEDTSTPEEIADEVVDGDTLPAEDTVADETVETADDTIEGEVTATDDSADSPVEGEVTATEDSTDSPVEGDDPHKTEETVTEAEAEFEDKPLHPDDGDPATEPDQTPEPDVVPDPEPVVQEKVVERVIERRRGFFPALIGGLVAAVFGFFAGRSDIADQYLPQALQSETSVIAAGNSAAITALQSQIADLSSDLAGRPVVDVDAIDASISDLGENLAPLPGAVGDLQSALDALGGQLAPVADRVAALDAELPALAERLTTVEKRPIAEGLSEDAIAAYEREFEGLQDTLAAQREELSQTVAAQQQALQDAATAQQAEFDRILSEAQTREEDAEASARRAAADTALAQLRSALDNGAPFAPQLGIIAAAGFEADPSLTSVAETGVVTLASLREEFAPAARAALAAVRSEEGNVAGDLGSFLAQQLGARSVTPREGDDADAVLSRAEAALTKGQLDTALTEISALSDTAKQALADWTAGADTRHAAISAADALSAKLNSN